MEEKILDAIEEISFKRVAMADSIFVSGLMDSMGIIDLAMLLEDKFDIKIDAADIIETNFDSGEKIKAYLEKRVS